jgi:hypothetical protein
VTASRASFNGALVTLRVSLVAHCQSDGKNRVNGDGKKSLILRSENSLHDSIHVILRNAFDQAVCNSNKERKHAIITHLCYMAVLQSLCALKARNSQFMLVEVTKQWQQLEC